MLDVETSFWIPVAQDEDAELDSATFIDLVLDTDGREREEVVDLILASTGWSESAS